MTKTRPRTRLSPQARKTQLLDTAKSMILRAGLRSFTMEALARNAGVYAEPGTPMSRFVERSFSDSILGSAKIESEPHPERKSVLIDLGALLLKDIPLLSHQLESTFRIAYRFDPKNSFFRKVAVGLSLPSPVIRIGGLSSTA